MLVLSRRVGEAIQIGDNIEVMVVRIASGTVRIGVVAPQEMPIVRQEIDIQEPSAGEEHHVGDEHGVDQFSDTKWLKSR